MTKILCNGAENSEFILLVPMKNKKVKDVNFHTGKVDVYMVCFPCCASEHLKLV